MNMERPYSHPPKEVTNEDGLAECLLCTRPLTGWGQTRRHLDEAVRPMEMSPAEAAALREAKRVMTEALECMWTDRCTDQDRAEVGVAALHRRGLVNVRQSRRRSSSAA